MKEPRWLFKLRIWLFPPQHGPSLVKLVLPGQSYTLPEAHKNIEIAGIWLSNHRYMFDTTCRVRLVFNDNEYIEYTVQEVLENGVLVIRPGLSLDHGDTVSKAA